MLGLSCDCAVRMSPNTAFVAGSSRQHVAGVSVAKIVDLKLQECKAVIIHLLIKVTTKKKDLDRNDPSRC